MYCDLEELSRILKPFPYRHEQWLSKLWSSDFKNYCKPQRALNFNKGFMYQIQHVGVKTEKF